MPYDARKDPQHHSGIFINPGTGPISGASSEEAESNIVKFMTEVGADRYSGPLNEDEGRFEFELAKDAYTVLIEMPGLPLDEVRYTGEDDQNIWDFPRLYVDGGSWIWYIGVDIAKRILNGQEDDDED